MQELITNGLRRESIVSQRDLIQKLGSATAVAGVAAVTTKKRVVAQGAMAEQKRIPLAGK